MATRLFAAQIVVIVIAGVTLMATVVVVAPGLFRHHLEMTGENSPIVQQHAQEAFESSFGLALVAAAVVAVAAAVFLSWFLTRRVIRPIGELAEAAESVAAGHYDIAVPSTGFGRELDALSRSFRDMADELAATDDARARLLADLAHEIRTPLATLEAHIDGMEDGIVPSAPETYVVMRSQVARLRRLASDIKEASAAQEHALGLQLRPLHLDQVIATASDAVMARFASDDVALVQEPTVGCGMINADPDRIQQVLANVLDNALRHTPSGGSVEISCAPTGDGQVRIVVADSGEGIPPDQLEAVFDRFHRVDAARLHNGDEGSGLGLTIARAIINDHGGTITADSGPGGTAITITLPLSSADQR